MIGRVIPAAVIFTAGMAFGQSSTQALPLVSQQALVSKHCVGCHNDRLKSGGFSWTKIDFAHPEANAARAEKVIRKVRAGMMPPAGAPRPPVSTLNAFATAVATQIDKIATLHPVAGAPDLHRLNRTEYRNSIRDLLGVDVEVSTMLPPDDLSHGFDNIADALTVTAALMQGYVRAAGKISRLAVGDPEVPPSMAKYDVPKVANQMSHVDGAPSGTRGGISVGHNFPADGDNTFKLTLYYYYTEELNGRALPPPLQGQQIEVPIEGERVGLFTINPQTAERDANFVTPPIKITGPYHVSGISDDAGRRKIFICRPASESDELPCAKKIIGELARQLLSAGANVGAITRMDRVTPVFAAARSGSAAMTGLLVKAGAQENIADDTGTTPLMLAAASGSAEAVNVLIEHGADVNAKENTWGETALMFATARDRAEVVRTLIAHGANPNITAVVARFDEVVAGLDDTAERRAAEETAAKAAEAKADGTKTAEAKTTETAEAGAAAPKSAEARKRGGGRPRGATVMGG